MKKENLISAILADRTRPQTTEAPACIACGRKFSGRDDGHCSDRCLAWTQRGEAPYSEHSRFDPFSVTRWRVVAGGDPGFMPTTPMRKGPDGFYISCRGCGSKFESKGMAYCPSCMALPAEERQGMRPPGRACAAPGCEKVIAPSARADAVYCSAACRQRGRRADKCDKNG